MMDTYEIERLERELPIWENADPTAFNDLEHLMMRTSAKLGREVLQLRAQLAAADRLAELCEPLMDGTIEVDDAPLHVGEWYTDLAFTIASYRAIRGKA